jgi:hypothetical protein
MTFTHVQGTLNNGSQSATFGSAVTSGNVVTGAINWTGSGGGAGAATVTDDKSNSYTVNPKLFDSGNGSYWATFFSTNAITNGPSVITATITGDPSVAFPAVLIDEWNGLGAGSTTQSSDVDSHGSSPLSVTLSNTTGDLCVAYATAYSGGATLTAGSGMTTAQNTSNFLAEWTTAGATSQVMGAAYTGAAAGYLYGMSFTPSGSPPPPPPPTPPPPPPAPPGTTYYVSNSGSDSNNGTSPSTPWQTIGHVNAQVYAYDDNILFNGGQTFSDAGLSLGTSNYDGTNPPKASHLLTIGSYGSGNATIAPTGAHGIKMTDIGYYEIENLTITGDNTSGKNGVWVNLTGAVSTLAAITLSTLTISNFGQCGIYAVSTSYSVTVTALTITGCVISGCTEGTGISGQASGGIYVTGAMGGDAHPTSTTRIFSSPTLSNCTVHDCQGASGTGNATSGQGIAVQSSTNALITNCLVYNCGANNQAGNGPTGLMFISCTNSVIKFCETYNISTGNGSDGDGIDLDGDTSGCTIEYCYVHACNGFGLMLYSYTTGDNNNNTIRWNIVQNVGNSNFPAIFVGGASPSGGKIYNNTVFCGANSTPCASGGSASGDAVFYNNIFFQNNNFVIIKALGTSYTFDGNCYYAPNGGDIATYNGTSYTTLSGFQTGASQEAHGVEENPALQNAGSGGTVGGYSPPAPLAYHLLGTSPLIGIGRDLNADYSINPGSQDFYGTTLSTPYNIGAYGKVGASNSVQGVLTVVVT